MIKKVRFSFDLTPRKINAVYRFLLILNKISTQFNFRALSQGFYRLTLSNRKNLQKLLSIQAIERRIVQQSFLTLKSYQKKNPGKPKSKEFIRNLSISVISQFWHRKAKQQKTYAFKKLNTYRMKKQQQKINTFLFEISKVSESLNRDFLAETFKRLKKKSFDIKKINSFFKALNLFVLKAQKQHLHESFSFISSEGFRKTHDNDLQERQEKINEFKNLQLHKHEQSRFLKVQINALTKTIQSEETSKNKSKKEDFDRNLILQAKNIQKQKSAQDFNKINFQNESLNHELSKKNCYLQIKQQSRAFAKSAQLRYQKTYGLLSRQNTKQSMSLKELSILLNRQNVDLSEILKKFGLSQQTVILDNIDLKNLQNLYERQMSGYGFGVNIKESEAYRKTMEQNVNLREILQILLKNILQGKQTQIDKPKEELNRLVQSYGVNKKAAK